ncbi:hypothetical protein QX25_02780, partial [Stutzerimonas stutzeri]
SLTVNSLFPQSPRRTNKVAQFQQNVLSGPRFRISTLRTAFVIGGEQDHGKADITVRNHFFDNGTSFISLLVQDDGF